MINAASKPLKKTGGYPRGLCREGRKFASRMQQVVLEAALAPWPRRHAPLLEVNCGNGAFLRFLWDCGFDVEAAEADPALRQKAASHNLPGLEIHAAHDNDLPFENDSFDWVIIHLKSGEPEAIAACANEALRVARRGFLITFWNWASVAALLWNLTHKKAWLDNSTSWWRVWRIVHGLKVGRISTVSAIFSPMGFWKHYQSEGAAIKLPLGAWCAVRLDLVAPIPATPLPLRLGDALSSPQPALEPFNNEITRSGTGKINAQKDESL